MSSIENNLGYSFKDKNLLNMALTHTSYSNEHGVESYERLEYLGDSVLQLIVSEFLYNNYSHWTSGELSKNRSHLVSTKNLAKITTKLQLDKNIKIGKALTKISDSLFADIFESILASIYLDGGYEKAKNFTLKNVIISKENVEKIIAKDVDYKTALQEKLQSLNPKPKIQYALIKTSVVDNKNYFTMELKIDNKPIAKASNFSKKACEVELSKIALENII